MYLHAKFGGHRCYRNGDIGDIDSYIKSYMDTLEIAELSASIRHIARFLKSGIPICNSEVPGTAGGYKKKNTGNCKAFCVSRKRK